MELLCEIDLNKLDSMQDYRIPEEEEEEKKENRCQEQNLLFDLFDQNLNGSLWRNVSPCFHATEKCPWGKNCSFQTLNQAIIKEEPMDCMKRSFEMRGFRELQSSLEKQYSTLPYPLLQRQALAPKDLGSPLKLPLEKYLREMKIVLATEKCQDPSCKGVEECGRRHYLTELFTQFDNPLLIKYFSYHLGRPVKPTIKSGGIFRCSNRCTHCNGKLFLAFPFLATHTITGSLEGPFVKFQCQSCYNITAFIVYQ